MMDMLAIILTGMITGAAGYAAGYLRRRREIRRLEDIVMALDDADDTPAWMRKFGRRG